MHIENALLTGKIDKILIDDEYINITDFKTGKSFDNFNTGKLKR